MGSKSTPRKLFFLPGPRGRTGGGEGRCAGRALHAVPRGAAGDARHSHCRDRRHPVETGIIASLARPGGNITGVSLMAAEAHGKCVEVFGDMLPSVRKVAA